MTHRHTVDTITSDALDTLYERLRKAERAVDLLADSHRRAERAEAALKRVRALAVYNRDHTAVGIDDYQIGQHELAVAVLDILQPGPAATQATKQPEIITDRATIRAALDEPGCTCTYGNRCPNCRD